MVQTSKLQSAGRIVSKGKPQSKGANSYKPKKFVDCNFRRTFSD